MSGLGLIGEGDIKPCLGFIITESDCFLRKYNCSTNVPPSVCPRKIVSLFRSPKYRRSLEFLGRTTRGPSFQPSLSSRQQTLFLIEPQEGFTLMIILHKVPFLRTKNVSIKTYRYNILYDIDNIF